MIYIILLNFVLYLFAQECSEVGSYDYPTNPMNDRALGYILAGEAKTGTSNFGNFIDWNLNPSGAFGQYAYIPQLSFVLGVPGQKYSSDYSWDDDTDELSNSQINEGLDLYCSADVYDDWPNYKAVIFNMADDRADIGNQVFNIEDFNAIDQYWVDDGELTATPGRVCITVDHYNQIDPEKSNAMIGLAYPWSIRPELLYRNDEFDQYNYGLDNQSWTDDDAYIYYGYTTQESWFTMHNPSYNTDWQPVTNSSENSHNTNDIGDIFSDIPFINIYNHGETFQNSEHLLAHNFEPSTWPENSNINNDLYQGFWPGEDLGYLDSDHHVYMEFDDRWAFRGNMIEDNIYQQTGYPLGIRVMVDVLGWNFEYLENMILFKITIRNESNTMIMPDGTKLNCHNGFDYKNIYIGNYFDAHDLIGDLYGYNPSLHTNNDDFIDWYWERFAVNNDSLLVSLPIVYDYDGNSGFADEVGELGTMFLDTPYADENIDLDENGSIDIYPGEPLKMTNWHWFDWYNRPGVVDRESGTNCCAGQPGRAQALNKEEIMYKVMAGDTTNLSVDEKRWFFHTPDPSLDSDLELNPHFDSLDGFAQEAAVNQDPYGADVLYLMSTGPFNLDVGEEETLVMALIFGEDRQNLIDNAKASVLTYEYNGLEGICSYLTADDLNGDINLDSILDISDVILMVNIIMNLTDNGLATIEHCQSDLNHDGVIDIFDIITLVNIILNT